MECTSDREAERLLYEFYNEKEKLLLQHNSYIPKTLGQLYNYWDEHYVKSNLSPSTAKWYHMIWDNHIKFAEQLKTETLSPAHIIKIIDTVESDRLKNSVYKMLNTIFNKAVK